MRMSLFALTMLLLFVPSSEGADRPNTVFMFTDDHAIADSIRLASHWNPSTLWGRSGSRPTPAKLTHPLTPIHCPLFLGNTNGPKELKALLMDDSQRMTEGLLKSMLTYAWGRPVGFADELEVQQTIEQWAKSDYGMRSLIRLVAQTKTFRSH